ncbi:MAG: hypothetical protein LBQ30_09690 [Treponema sp.]|nr:hypothetical protein [Treponema sp.]
MNYRGICRVPVFPRWATPYLKPLLQRSFLYKKIPPGLAVLIPWGYTIPMSLIAVFYGYASR